MRHALLVSLPVALVLSLSACGKEADCPAGYTKNADDLCVEDESAGEEGDADTDADADSDTDADGDADADTDADSDADGDPDADGDGYPASEDCNDGDGVVHPGATETCGNGQDDDCDGTANDCGWSGDHVLPEDALVLGGYREKDHTGEALAAGGDVNGDGQADLIVGGFHFQGGVDTRGIVYVVEGPVTSDLSLIDEAASFLGYGEESSGDYPEANGLWLDMVGDVDGDGYGDLVLTDMEPRTDRGETSSIIYIKHGPFSGQIYLPDEAEDAWTAEEPADAAGMGDDWLSTGVTGVGDVTGDGLPDVLTVAREYDLYGAAYVIPSPALSGGELEGTLRYYGNQNGEGYAESVNVIAHGHGDIDGDGVGELLLVSDSSAGIFKGPLVGDAFMSDAEVVVEGAGYATLFVEWAGDITGDGLDDALFCQPDESTEEVDYAGVIYLMSGTALQSDADLAFAESTIEGDENTVRLGAYAVDGIGDVNWDEKADFMVGSQYVSDYGYSSGATFLFTDVPSGSSSVRDLATAAWYGTHEEDCVGVDVSGGVDLTGDGLSDVLIGASGYDGDEASSGAALLFPGGGW